MSTEQYVVEGMTCQHCVASVTEEVSGIASVTDVAVDLESGQVTLTSDQPIGQELVRAAVEEAGYTLVSP